MAVSVTSLRCRVQRVNEWRSGGEQSAGAARTTHEAPGRGGAGGTKPSHLYIVNIRCC